MAAFGLSNSALKRLFLPSSCPVLLTPAFCILSIQSYRVLGNSSVCLLFYEMLAGQNIGGIAWQLFLEHLHGTESGREPPFRQMAILQVWEMQILILKSKGKMPHAFSPFSEMVIEIVATSSARFPLCSEGCQNVGFTGRSRVWVVFEKESDHFFKPIEKPDF